MNTTVINIKADKTLKKDAQMLAKNFGLPLSVIVNTYLKEFVRERRIVFSLPPVLNVKTKKIWDNISKTETHLASESSLAKDWFKPVEQEAWKNL